MLTSNDGIRQTDFSQSLKVSARFMAKHLLPWRDPAPEACRHGLITIGNFDGVHLGHQALVRDLKGRASELGVPAIVLTFDPHPLWLLRPESFLPPLTTVGVRSDWLLNAGADEVGVIKADLELLQLTGQEFFHSIVVGTFGARGLVEGGNFRFGRNRLGDINLLDRLSAQHGMLPVHVPDYLSLDGVPVSSSRVRRALVEGDVREATRLMNRPYRVTGGVGTGKQRGHLLGFPTANLESITTLIPKDGVYAGLARVGGEIYKAACNVGTNPTFEEQDRKVEVHLLDFKGDLYRQTMTVEFVDRLRDVTKFEGVDALIQQLKVDVERVRGVLKT